MYDDCPLSQFIEYKFEDEVWRVSKVVESSAVAYKDCQFKNWEKMFLETDCQATLENEEKDLRVRCTNQLHFQIHQKWRRIIQWLITKENSFYSSPVSGLRVWDR
eukprot:UN04653